MVGVPLGALDVVAEEVGVGLGEVGGGDVVVGGGGGGGTYR